MLKSQTTPERLSALIGGTAFIFICRVSGAALTFATQVLLARWMGATELGIYVVAFSWCLILSTLGGFGFPFAAIRFIGEGLSRSDMATVNGFVARGAQIVFGVSISIALLGMLVLYILPGSGNEIESSALLFAMVAVPFLAILRFDTGCANAASMFGLSFIPNNIARPLLFLLVISIVWFAGGTLNAGAAMHMHMFVIVVVTIGSFILIRQKLRRRTGNGEKKMQTRLWVRTGIPLLLMDLFGSFFPELTVIIVGAFLPHSEVGVYAIAFRVAMLIMFGLNAVDAYVAPKITGLYATDDHGALADAVDRATQLRFIGAVVGAIALLLFGNQILAVFGPEFAAGRTALIFLVAALVVSAAVGPVIKILSVTGHQDNCMYVLLLVAVIAVGAIAGLTPHFGVSGAAAGASIAMVSGSLMMRALVVRLVGLRPNFLPGTGRDRI